jgi:hypothetical protein
VEEDRQRLRAVRRMATDLDTDPLGDDLEERIGLDSPIDSHLPGLDQRPGLGTRGEPQLGESPFQRDAARSVRSTRRHIWILVQTARGGELSI